jgi:hypothetical protein
VYEIIKSLRPYFFSLREIEGNVSLDIKLPLNWKYEDIIKPYRSIKTKVQDKNEKFSLLSIIANATEEGYKVSTACAMEIINVNKEEEDKQKLFQEKVKELQVLFQKESLDKLKDMSFIQDEQFENSTGVRLADEGDGEGPEGDTDEQEEID